MGAPVQEIGCFRDASSRAISGDMVEFSYDEVVWRCYLRAKNFGYTHFAVQYNTECFTSYDAGETYDKYGSTSGCANGRGGSWKMTVYSVEDLGFGEVGCFRDESTRAIRTKVGNFSPEDVVGKCYEYAREKGYSHFAVQYNKECWTAPDAGETYHKYCSTSGCANGRGGSWKNTVYLIY